MEGCISSLRSRYRIGGAQTSAPTLAARLDRALHHRVFEYYEEALERVLPDSETVYILRRVDASMMWILNGDSTDSALAKNWGFNLANAVARNIAAGENDPANFVRFHNQADYVTHFLVALLKGTAQGQWFYGGFAEFATLDSRSAIKRVLLENRSHLPLILAYLHQQGELEELIRQLDKETKQALWTGSTALDEIEVDRSLFMLALQLVDKADGWANVPRNGENLFRNFRAAAVTRCDWRDPRSLSAYVFEVVRYLISRNYLSLTVSGEGLKLRLIAAVKEYEWLDREWLKESVADLFEQSEEAAAQLPLRMPNCATPRQRELLTTIGHLLSDAPMPGTLGSDPQSISLKLLALLVAKAPQWADDKTAQVMIENLVTAAGALQRAGDRNEFLRLLQTRNSKRALTLLKAAERARVRVPCEFVAQLGQPAIDLLDKLFTSTPLSELTDGVVSQYAGFSLLLRSCLDVRLHTLWDISSYPVAAVVSRAATLFLLLARHLFGEQAMSGDEIDPGLCLLTGIEPATEPNLLQRCWSNAKALDHSRFQMSLLNVAAGLRLLEPSVMHVFDVELSEGQRALVAADETASLWPLGRIVNSNLEAATVIRDFQQAWEQATGSAPRILSDDSIDRPYPSSDASDDVLARDNELSARHRDGRKALLQLIAASELRQTANANIELTMFVAGNTLVRLWARWLRGFATASVPFLLENFLRRQGRIWTDADGLVVELERRPLDVVLEMAGYFSDLKAVPWLSGGRLKLLVKDT